MAADLTTKVATYLKTLQTTYPGEDLNTAWTIDRPIVKAAIEALGAEDDENTMYYRYITVP
jgi:hypothetical protein